MHLNGSSRKNPIQSTIDLQNIVHLLMKYGQVKQFTKSSKVLQTMRE